MKMTIEIHDAWLSRPEDLRRALSLLAGLEDPPTGTGPTDQAQGPRGELEDPSDPEDRPRGRQGRYSGDDDRSQASRDEDGEDEDPPTDGRQLLGWAAKQVPDAKGRVIAVGKKRGFPSRILDWTPQQVQAAYRYARAQTGR